MKIAFMRCGFLISIVVISQMMFAQGTGLLINLVLSKQEFLVGEPIFVEISLVNTGNAPIQIRRFYLGFDYFKIVVKDQAGNEYPYGMHRSEVPPDSTASIKLQPHDTISRVVDLLPLLGKGKYQLRDIHTRTFFEPGSYTAQASYVNDKNRIYSIIGLFTVMKPRGRDSKAYEFLVRATELELALKKDRAGAVLDSLIQEFPESAYHILAFIQKFKMYEWSNGQSDQEQGYKAALSLIESYPSSEAADIALTHIMVRADRLMKTPKERKELLIKLVKEHPGTRIEKQAKAGLKKIEGVE